MEEPVVAPIDEKAENAEVSLGGSISCTHLPGVMPQDLLRTASTIIFIHALL